MTCVIGQKGFFSSHIQCLPPFYKPNIVFKVHDGVNLKKDDPNYDLLQLALNCTAKKMIPTYLLCDCKCDKEYKPENLSIMGCRTRVVTDLFGEDSVMGRGNIANISINLPRLALEVEQKYSELNIDEKMDKLMNAWDEIASITKEMPMISLLIQVITYGVKILKEI